MLQSQDNMCIAIAGLSKVVVLTRTKGSGWLRTHRSKHSELSVILGSCTRWVHSSPSTHVQEQPQHHTLVSRLWVGPFFKIRFHFPSLEKIYHERMEICCSVQSLKETVESGWPSATEQCRKTGCIVHGKSLRFDSSASYLSLSVLTYSQKNHFHCLLKFQWKNQPLYHLQVYFWNELTSLFCSFLYGRTQESSRLWICI